jgi:iron complex transport system permease protein
MTASDKEPNRRGRAGVRLGLLCVALAAAVGGSLMVGRYGVTLGTVWRLLTAAGDGGLDRTILLRVRLPRVLVAMLIGAGLSASGAAYQGLFKNPMVSPDILGASAGAGCGAAAGILAGLDMLGVQLVAFASGVAAVTLTAAVSSRMARRGDPVLVMVLVGIIIASVCTSAISLIKTVADPDNKLPAITFWLMGGLSSVTLADAKFLLIVMPIGFVPLWLIRWRLNVLSFGEEEAAALGVNPKRLRWVVILAATLLTASSVSVAGLIGWVGLVVPHLARMIVGPSYKAVLPASLVMGGVYLLLVDDVARTAMPTEIALGILTSLIGAPFFRSLLLRSHRGWA